MKIHTHRTSFTVFVCDSQMNRGHGVAELLGNVGYQVEHKLNEAAFWREVAGNPPHVILLYWKDGEFYEKTGEGSFIDRATKALPETQFILLTPEETFADALAYYKNGFYDIVRSSDHDTELLHAVDRACELNYRLYTIEQLRERAGVSDPTPVTADASSFEVWLRDLQGLEDPKTCVDRALAALSRLCEGLAVYMKFNERHSTLVVDAAAGNEVPDLKDVGLDLAATEPGFDMKMLKTPQNLTSLRDFVHNGLACRHHFAAPLIVDNRVRGLFLLANPAENYFNRENFPASFARATIACLRERLELLTEKEKRRKLSTLDEESGVSNSDITAAKIREEITRARRILRPVSLLLIGVDRLADIRLECTDETASHFLQALCEVFLQNSRTNDFVGRWHEGLFAVLLPHTDRKGAAIKAERLRRIIENADFSRVFGKQTPITVRVGVGEYPSMCQDAEGLVRVAEGALNEVEKVGGNKVCLASPPRHFVPDFEAGDV